MNKHGSNDEHTLDCCESINCKKFAFQTQLIRAHPQPSDYTAIGDIQTNFVLLAALQTADMRIGETLT